MRFINLTTKTIVLYNNKGLLEFPEYYSEVTGKCYKLSEGLNVTPVAILPVSTIMKLGLVTKKVAEIVVNIYRKESHIDFSKLSFKHRQLYLIDPATAAAIGSTHGRKDLAMPYNLIIDQERHHIGYNGVVLV